MAIPIRHWELFLDLSAKKAGKKKEALEKQAKTLIEEYLANGYLRLSPKESLSIDPYAYALFYSNIAAERVRNGRIASPVAHLENSSWMVQSDFCFINVRACGPHRDKPGTFMDALRLLPLLRVSSIHLAPFFDCIFGNVYAIDSLAHIAPEIVDHEYEKDGLNGSMQLTLLVDIIHSLGMTVGFDLEPHTSQFSRVVLDHPEQFRWLEISQDRKSLAGKVAQDTMLQEDSQVRIHDKVRSIVESHKKKHGLDIIDTPDLPYETISAIQGAIIGELIKDGLWTMPSHTWGGVGLPEFVSYNTEGNYPVFEYLDCEGEDQSGHAFGMLTPIKFAGELKSNLLPSLKHPSRPWQPGIDFFAGLFPSIQETYGFDFVRLDYVDHVFDSVIENTRDLPLADRPTPYVLEQVIHASRAGAPFLGAMAERMGYDFEDYASCGFDLVLGADVIRSIDVDFLEDMLLFNSKIADFNTKHNSCVSIQYAIDTHDTGHPGINTNPVQYGRQGMLLRLFLSRFGNCGKGRRPKYEVIGNQDMSAGLYEANNQPVSLDWADDREFFDMYQNFEDVYASLKETLAASSIREYSIEEQYAIWYMDRDDGKRSRLVCICYPGGGEEDFPISSIKIFPFNQYSFSCARIEQIDLVNNTRQYIPIEPDGTFIVEQLLPGTVRLYCISESA